MIAAPETRYATTADGLAIAFQTLGEGPRDIVLVWEVQCIDLMWDEPSFARMLRRLGGLGRLICVDCRGFGGSDPVPLGALPMPETWMEDVGTVLDAVGSTSAHLICHGSAGFMGMVFAATYPERTATLILLGPSARIVADDDYAIGMPPEQVDAFVASSQQQWGTGALAGLWSPGRRGDEAFRLWSARFERGSTSPGTNGALLRWVSSLDMRAVLPSIRVPTLVLHAAGDRLIPASHGAYVADHLLHGRSVVIPSSDRWFFSDRPEDAFDEIEEFVTGVRPVREPDRALATVLFTDIVASTDNAARLGDKAWTLILDDHDSIVTRELERHRGRKVNPTGDGMLATFDGPARGVRCAQAICEQVRDLGIEVRAGLHTGEVELRGDDIGGIAVHIGQRVSSLAGPGEVLVSRTVRDLVTGSGLEFHDRGEQHLKGVPGTWAVFALST